MYQRLQSFFPVFYRVALIVISGLFSLGQLQRIELPFGRAFYLHEIAILIFLSVFFVQKPTRLFRYIRTCKVIQAVLLFDAWVILTSLIWFHNDPTHLFTGLLYLLRINVLVLFGRAIYTLVKKKVVSPYQIKAGMLFSVCLIAMFGFGQYFFIPDTRELLLLGWDEHYLRLISTIFDPGFTGILLAIAGLLLVKDVGECDEKCEEVCVPISCTKKSLMFTLCFLALLFTYSRASFLAFGAGLLYLFFAYKKKAYLFLIFLTVAGIFVLPRPPSEGARLERTASAVSRVESMQKAFADMKPMHYLFGIGWYNFKQGNTENTVNGVIVQNHASAPENSYIFVLTSLGIIGFGLWIYVLIVFAGVGKWKGDPMIALVAISVHAMFTNTFFHTFVLLLLAVIMGYSGPLAQSLSRSKPHSAPLP